MALKDIFTMVKADRYTQDGREEIIKAQKTEVEDRTYNIGEISQKTGLMKTANGWVEPPKGKAKGAKTGSGKSPVKQSSNTEKWTKTKDYLGNERISMKTPQGGLVSIYETDNPKQKNNRFRVDTGTHADYFNTMEEAKAYAEKHHGEGSESKQGSKLEEKKAALKEIESMIDNAGDYDDIEEMEKERQKLIKEIKKEEKSAPAKTESKPSAPKALKLPDEKSSFQTDVNRMKKLKKEDYKQYTVQLEKLHSKYPINKWKDLLAKTTSDAAPRVLTGDCKIRIKK